MASKGPAVPRPGVVIEDISDDDNRRGAGHSDEGNCGDTSDQRSEASHKYSVVEPDESLGHWQGHNSASTERPMDANSSMPNFHTVFFSGVPHNSAAARVQQTYHTVSPTMYGLRHNNCEIRMQFEEDERVASIQVTARVDGEPLDVVPKVFVDVTKGGLGENRVDLNVHSRVAKTWHVVARVAVTKVAAQL